MLVFQTLSFIGIFPNIGLEHLLFPLSKVSLLHSHFLYSFSYVPIFEDIDKTLSLGFNYSPNKQFQILLC